MNLPDNLIAIGTELFKNFKNLIKLDFLSTLKTIGPYAFFNCDDLKRVNLETTGINLQHIIYIKN